MRGSGGVEERLGCLVAEGLEFPDAAVEAVHVAVPGLKLSQLVRAEVHCDGFAGDLAGP